MTFNPSEHLMQIGYRENKKDYLEVKWRLVWYREMCPEGTIETEMVLLDLDRPTQDEQKVWNNEKRRMESVVKEANGFVIFRATVKDGKGGVAVGTKSEKAAAFPDFIEKCESGAVGRALAMLGYGTQFTGDELKEGHRIVDSPVEPQQTTSTTPPQPVPSEIQPDGVKSEPPTPSQLQKECEALYGSGKWDGVMARLGFATKSDDDLTPADCQKIANALANVRAKRRAA